MKSKDFNYVDIHSEAKKLKLKGGSLCFTYCQVPIVYQLSDESSLVITHRNGTLTKLDTLSLDATTSRQIFDRTGEVIQLNVQIKQTQLR